MTRSEEVCRHLLPAGRREWRAGDLHGAKGKSFGVNLKTGVWSDFVTGESGADLIDLIKAAKNLPTLKDALDEGARFLGWPTEGGRRMERPSDFIDPGVAGDDALDEHEPDGTPFWRHKPADKAWYYHDEDGRLYCRVNRWNRKNGKKVVRPYDPVQRGFVWPKLRDGAKHPPFCLPQILNLPPDWPILVVGGEKTAEAARALGYSATTNMGGENAVAMTDWSCAKGRRVVICPDNDAQGTKWARQLADLLWLAGAAEVRILPAPPGTPPKWDLADPLPNGWAQDDLRAALASTPLAASSSGLQRRLTDEIIPIDWPSKEGRVPPERNFIVGAWLPAGCVTSPYGAGGVGKSLLAQQLATCVATGKPFCSHPVRSGPVLGLFCEDDELWRRQAGRGGGRPAVDRGAAGDAGRAAAGAGRGALKPSAGETHRNQAAGAAGPPKNSPA